MDKGIFNMNSGDDEDVQSINTQETTVEDEQNQEAEDTSMDDDKEQIDRYISDIPYPTTKEDMIEFAKTQGDSISFLDKLDKLPEGTYESAEEVHSAINEFE